MTVYLTLCRANGSTLKMYMTDAEIPSHVTDIFNVHTTMTNVSFTYNDGAQYTYTKQ